MGKKQFDDEILKIIAEVINESVKSSKKNRLELFRELNKTVRKNSIVFAGDSIIQRYPLDEMLQTNTCIYNRGIDGIEAMELLDNINEHIIELEPRKLFVMVGTNDLGAGVALDEIISRLKQIIYCIKDNLPNTELYMISLCPINEEIVNAGPNFLERRRTNELLRELNQTIYEEVTKPEGIKFIDIHTSLTDQNGELKSEYTTDGLHLSAIAYRKVTDILAAFLDE